MLTVPDGSAETFTNDVDWIAPNLEYEYTRWSTVVSKAQTRNIKVIPWVRLAHVAWGEGLDHIREQLQLLVTTARIWNTDWILPNYEDEASTFAPSIVKKELDDTGWQGNTGWSVQGWVPNDVDYSPMGNDPALLQIFPTDLRWPKDYATIKAKMGDCIYHAREGGFTYISVTYQTYDNATPSLYDVESYQHSTFPGNVILSGEWPSWYG